jgi:hypothetical protein
MAGGLWIFNHQARPIYRRVRDAIRAFVEKLPEGLG